MLRDRTELVTSFFMRGSEKRARDARFSASVWSISESVKRLKNRFLTRKKPVFYVKKREKSVKKRE